MSDQEGGRDMAGWAVALGGGVLAVLLLALLGTLVVSRSAVRPPAAPGPGPSGTGPDVPAPRRSPPPAPSRSPVGPAPSRSPVGPAPADPAPSPGGEAADAGAAVPPDLAAAPGTVLLLQFSAAFCTASRDCRAVLADVAAGRPDRVRTRDVDVVTRPELVDRLAVGTPPTTLLVDARGAELGRFAGVPRRAQVADLLRGHVPSR